jgi:hypothetical protein
MGHWSWALWPRLTAKPLFCRNNRVAGGAPWGGRWRTMRWPEAHSGSLSEGGRSRTMAPGALSIGGRGEGGRWRTMRRWAGGWPFAHEHGTTREKSPMFAGYWRPPWLSRRPRWPEGGRLRSIFRATAAEIVGVRGWPLALALVASEGGRQRTQGRRVAVCARKGGRLRTLRLFRAILSGPAITTATWATSRYGNAR